MSDASAIKPHFGDMVENGWASEGNPTRRGYFVRSFTRKGRLNPGLTWEITDGEGKFWELQPRVIGDRLTTTPAPDLLEALKEVLAVAEDFVPIPLSAPGFKRARAAIAKALGREEPK